MRDKTHPGAQAMERVEEKFKFHHFSHEHPLELTNSPPKHNKTCAGCKLMIVSGKDYCCTTCPFSLHQVCYNMPQKTRHPAHPNHYLNLHHSPPNTKGTISCQACGDPVAGFYYDCAECGLYYHSLCSTLPLSIATSSHPHALKLSFSPPFDLCCDICSEPSYDGWQYRCHICEFDTHIFCAISNQTVVEPPQNPIPPLLPNNTFSRNGTKHSSAIFSLGINVADNYNNESNELLQLARQKVFSGNIKSNIDGDKAAVTGWDERLYSPKQNFNVRISHIGHDGSHQTDADHMTIASSKPKQQLVPQDPQTPVSEDMTMTPSYQFSDAYFSIDLAKSYSPCGVKIQGRKESSDQGPKGTAPEVQVTFGNRDTITPNKVSSNSKQGKQPTFVNRPGINNSNKDGPENRLNEAFLTRGDTPTRKELGPKEKKIKASQNMVWSAVGNQSTKSDAERSSPSFWQNLFTCCINPGYERSAKGFQEGSY